MLLQDFFLLAEIVLVKEAQIFEFLVIDDGDFPEQVPLSEVDELEREIEPNTLQQPLPCDLVEPVELQRKRK